MDKLVELNRQYWGPIHDMCEGTSVKPWECVRFKASEGVYDGLSGHPDFLSLTKKGLNEIEFAVAILEGKPVFVDDVLYATSPNVNMLAGGKVYTYQSEVHVLFDDKTDIRIDNLSNSLNLHFTWTPPAKKRTFMLNGKELPCPCNFEDDKANYALEIFGAHFYFDTAANYHEVTKCIAEILTEARDK